ncbi:hypothetical protein Poli38472_004603 [Pythium oligandrum]|uniref:Uncharacterized protein n=1 Tax=Pythium oligandrum TaxID=41045 RepID=A0A8K1FG18_PYTOL|nr:hypothetical protein Poli38472_004603 [Pythium oligandrum]|eukprot:TMW59534.1 hypothetical protein Poli38472_004603 [Pythium oligandrum]
MSRRAMAKANAHVHESDDDEAPEVVSKASAKEQALERLRHEEEARVTAPTRRKRKAPTAREEIEATEDADEQADGEEEEAPELPADVLSALATRDEEEREENELEAKRERQRRKRAAAMKQRSHIRDFGTVQVQTLEALDASESRKLNDAAVAFLERKSAPQRARMNVLEGHPSLFTKKQKTRAARM